MHSEWQNSSILLKKNGYLEVFNDFMAYEYDDDVFDAEYLGHCQYMKNKMVELYKQIPQFVPGPTYPYYSL